jgi:lipopolysaccharide/colanic/teichoic acid biosynthesis glycosyltransferase
MPDISVTIRRRPVLLGAPVQIAFALVLCVVVPYVANALTSIYGWHDPVAQTTSSAAAIAILVGFWLHRSVSALPGTRESSTILPSYLVSFGLVLVTILMVRLDYSRVLLASGFGLSIACFYAVYLVSQRHSVLHLGIVPGGKSEAFFGLENVRAVRLTLEELPHGLDAVSADLRHSHSDAWEARLADYVLAGLPVYHAKNLLESLTGRTELEHLSENTFGTLGPLAPFQKAKRVVDWVCALGSIALLFPVLLIVAAMIRIDSPGPALFRQERVGFRGQPFRVFKFRTMVARSPKREHERSDFMTSPNDERITRIGRVLRKTRIDELPQILNILRGEMSWIGPRPEAAKLSEWYTEEIPFYRYRHVVYPGITGWAQVTQGHVADVADVREKLEYDFYYIRNFSFWLDLLIIAKTLKTMATGFGHR